MASAVTVTEGLYAFVGSSFFAFAAGVRVFVTRLTSISKRFAALAPLRASRANLASVSSRVSAAFMG